MNILKEVLYWSWCLPQTLLGLVLKLITKSKKAIYLFDDKLYKFNICSSDSFGGISLGKYIIVGIDMDDKDTIKHEYGHQIQSFILGPLYLLIIGLPSLLWCYIIQDSINKIRRKKGKQLLSYYWFYPEKWANYLGKVKEEV